MDRVGEILDRMLKANHFPLAINLLPFIRYTGSMTERQFSDLSTLEKLYVYLKRSEQILRDCEDELNHDTITYASFSLSLSEFLKMLEQVNVKKNTVKKRKH